MPSCLILSFNFCKEKCPCKNSLVSLFCPLKTPRPLDAILADWVPSIEQERSIMRPAQMEEKGGKRVRMSKSNDRAKTGASLWHNNKKTIDRVPFPLYLRRICIRW